MTAQRNVEIYSAGCAVCEDAIKMVRDLACDSWKVTVRDMTHPKVAEQAQRLGIRSVPAVVIDGRLADCCGAGLDAEVLKQAGLGQPL
ncbi:thioredoxin family protein [Nitrospina sp. 32_T5]|uniref:thioredoxin family protein n=1 Tax=unclassified Nitrospina TaxID=2638683 RepID=UPI003F9B3A10